MKITSPSFEGNQFIPERFSYEEGDCVNPELRISGVPGDAKSLVLTIEDVDAPSGSFFHWVVFNIPSGTTVIEEDSIPGARAVNDAKRKNYTGPRPPSGTHRYVFKLFALDTMLDLKDGAAKEAVFSSMQGHILEESKLTGRYARKETAKV